MFTIDYQPWPKYSVHFKAVLVFFFLQWDVLETQQPFSGNVEFRLMQEGGAVAAKEGAVPADDQVPIAGKRGL